tara:strand:- start:2163 stop:4415 length:2253 start_codon:yes stop_codon:yes gene_type:complete
MFRKISTGSVAPLAILFTMLSMAFTAAYLKNSFSMDVMEKYRYSEWKALYAAEAGLNEVGIVVLPQITSDTLLLGNGVEYGADENGERLGTYEDIACSTRLQIGSTRKEYIAYSTGIAEYTTPSGTDVQIKRRVYTTMVPAGFEEFMYFTHEEKPIGPGNTGNVNFGSSDELEGKVHTNGVINLSNNCSGGGPKFSGEVNITFEAIDENGSGVNYGGCNESVFEVDDINILDTVSQIIFPPDNSAETARQNATRVLEADDKLFRGNQKDTLIMTEINFVQGGYWATQWWYNIPPVGSPPAEYDFFWDSTNYVNLDPPPAGFSRFALSNVFNDAAGNYDPQTNMLIVSVIDADGNNIQSEFQDLVENGDVIRIENEAGTKVATFIANAVFPGDGNIKIIFTPGSLTYFNADGKGFSQNERVTVINTSASTGLAEDVEWNSFYYYHDHGDNSSEFCEAGRLHHFDFEYWNYGGISGNNCDIFNCPDIIYNSEYVHMNRTFFSKGSSPQVIYVRGGQVLVRGTVDGLYTIVTDDFTEYRRHDNMDIIDRVWGNIWLIDDIVYLDSDAYGEVIHPEDGGSDHVLGLIAGGSVIIANTRPNGARGGCTDNSEDDECHIRINASLLAMNGGFLSHYWQNTLTDFHDIDDNLPYGIIADGRGGHRNYYRPETSNGIYTGVNDKRGDVKLYGSIVQFQRGYMLRNTVGPYNATPGVGYDKDYHYDWNLRMRPPPYFPDLQSSTNQVILKMASYGEAKN